MKSVLLSTNPLWCMSIFVKVKKIEVRKSKPSLKLPFKVIVYCTKGGDEFYINHNNGESICGNGKVIGEFTVDRIDKYPFKWLEDGNHIIPFGDLEKTCLDGHELYKYLGNKDGYGWHITNPILYDKPKELSEFVKPCNHKNDCYTCKRRRYSGLGIGFYECDNAITRPPQSWCYVERMG